MQPQASIRRSGRAVPSIALALVFALAGAPLADGPQQEPKQPYTIALDVALVVLDVTVLDSAGGYASGLEQDQFKVYEDGRLQKIEFFTHEDIPVTIGLVVDSSGSMRRKRREVIGAALSFAVSSNPEDEMFVVHFNEKVSFALGESKPFTSSIPELRSGLLASMPEGQTALYDAAAAALEHLDKARYDKKVLLVVSDGGDNASTLAYRDLLDRVHRSTVTVYTISLFDEDSRERNDKPLRELSKVSGGEFFAPRTLGEVGSICRRIAKDIRSHYTIGYRPERAADAGYRALRVTVDAPGRRKLHVRTRTGYFSGSRTERGAGR